MTMTMTMTMTKTMLIEDSALFHQSLKLILNLCTLGGGQRAICPGIRHTAYCVMRMPLVARRPYSSTSLQELSKELHVVMLLVMSCCCWLLCRDPRRYRVWRINSLSFPIRRCSSQYQAMYHCSSDHDFEWPPFLHLSRSHSSRLPILWLVFLLSFEFLSI